MHRLRAAEYPQPDYVLLHISDTHLIGGDGSLYGAVDADGWRGELRDVPSFVELRWRSCEQDTLGSIVDSEAKRVLFIKLEFEGTEAAVAPRGRCYVLSPQARRSPPSEGAEAV